MKNKISLSELQAHLDEVCKTNGWDKNSIPEVFLLFTEECGELAKAVRKELGFKGEKKPENHDNLIDEFADVLNFLLELANRFNIDLTDAYFKKHDINKNRIWK